MKSTRLIASTLLAAGFLGFVQVNLANAAPFEVVAVAALQADPSSANSVPSFICAPALAPSLVAPPPALSAPVVSTPAAAAPVAAAPVGS